MAEEPKIVEGNAKIFSKEDVFYNETQVFNRDCSVLAAQVFFDKNQYKQPKILDALSATGLRAIRYGSELQIENLQVTANDLSESSFSAIQNNIKMNKLEGKVLPRLGDATQINDKFDYIDLDPYGHPTPFIYSALTTISDHGFLGLTATDGMISCSFRQQVECLARYGSQPFDGPQNHEAAVRMMLGNLAVTCVERKIAMEVVFSFYKYHYQRAFVRVDKKHPGKIAELIKEIGYVNFCKNCGNVEVDHLMSDSKVAFCSGRCWVCFNKYQRAGPFYLGKLHDDEFIKEMKERVGRMPSISTVSMIKSMINYQLQELPGAFYQEISQISQQLKTPMPGLPIVAGFCAAVGAEFSFSSYSATGVKTTLSQAQFRGFWNLWTKLCCALGRSKVKYVLALCERVKQTDSKAIQAVLDALVSDIAEYKLSLETVVAIAAAVGHPVKGDETDVKALVTEDGLIIAIKFDEAKAKVKEEKMFLENPSANWGPKKMAKK